MWGFENVRTKAIEVLDGGCNSGHNPKIEACKRISNHELVTAGVSIFDNEERRIERNRGPLAWGRLCSKGHESLSS